MTTSRFCAAAGDTPTPTSSNAISTPRINTLKSCEYMTETWTRPRRSRDHGDGMIAFSKVGKQYGKQVLFVDASFQLNPGEKVGLVGPNGSGKTTLFRMIVGEESPDEGDVSVP